MQPGGVLFIFGSGAQGRVVRDILAAQYPQAMLYFVDDNPALNGSVINGSEVITTVAMFTMEPHPEVHIALGNPHTREKIWDRLQQAGAEHFISAIHPSAVVAPTATIGDGCMVGIGAIVNSNAQIARGCIINTGAVVEHDTQIAAFACVSPRAMIGGRVTIGAKAFVASGAIVLARLTIGRSAVVGMGAVLLKDVPDEKIFYGSPASEKGAVNADFDWSRLF
jgi:sugar O-acyltransferase (sialic acid O-acetyltransferase NeuD family)